MSDIALLKKRGFLMSSGGTTNMNIYARGKEKEFIWMNPGIYECKVDAITIAMGSLMGTGYSESGFGGVPGALSQVCKLEFASSYYQEEPVLQFGFGYNKDLMTSASQIDLGVADMVSYTFDTNGAMIGTENPDNYIKMTIQDDIPSFLGENGFMVCAVEYTMANH